MSLDPSVFVHPNALCESENVGARTRVWAFAHIMPGAVVGAAIENELARLMRGSEFILGERVARFEKAFASFCGARHCAGVANGTDALELAFRALGIGPGDEVLVPANTFAATALAVVRAGAEPRFVDCDAFHLIDVSDAEGRIGPRTKAIVPVHLYGQMAAMEDMTALAGARGLIVVEDAAQAHGASRNGRPPGSDGRAATYSFYPSKNLGAYGDAGAVVTNDDDVDASVRALRNYGSDIKYEHPVAGFNSRLDALQAAVLSAKLPYLDGWNDRRREAAAHYDEMLSDLDDVVVPAVAPGNVHVWHVYVVRVPRRDAVLASLHEQGVGAGVHYPKPLHLQGAFATLGYEPGDFPAAESAAGEALSLPLYPEITTEQQERVVDALRKALS